MRSPPKLKRKMYISIFYSQIKEKAVTMRLEGRGVALKLEQMIQK